MSIKIHHGPDGTFKTSGAIKDDIMKVVKSGRILVTNIRGFSRDKTIEVLGEDNVHENFDVIHIDTDVENGRQKMSKFFHWAPKGAFFVIDEVQRVFPPKWTERDLAKLNYLESQDHLPEDERKPETIHVAWDMQRHHNWDFVFTTTNIKKVHDMARLMAKVAVRHVNVGLWRFYKTVEHDAESNGKTAASITSVKLFNFVPSRIFQLYASTTTGTFENTEPRTPFYKDFKIVSLVLILVCLWVYVLNKPTAKVFSENKSKVVQTDEVNSPKDGNVKSGKVDSKNTVTKDTNIRSGSQNIELSNYITNVKNVPATYMSQFTQFFINGYSKTSNSVTITYTAYMGETKYRLNSDTLRNYGVTSMLMGECLAELKFSETSLYVFCEPTKIEQPLQQYDFQPPASLTSSYTG